MIHLNSAALFAIIIEGILYGTSLPFLGTAIWALFVNRSKNHHKGSKRLMLGVCLILLSLSTAHVAINIGRVYLCIIKEKGDNTFCADIRQPTFNIKNGILGTTMSIGDALTIYRVFAVWRNYWILCGLGILWVGVTVAGIGTELAVSQNIVPKAGWPIFGPLAASWVTSLWILGFVCNASATFFLAYRIWSLSRSHPSRDVWVTNGRNGWWSFLTIILDSAALYSIILMVMLIIALTRSNGQFVVLDMIPPIICISFYVIIIRVHWFAESDKAKISDIPGIQPDEGENIRLQTVQVHIDRFEQNDLNRTVAKTFGSESNSLSE